MARARSVEQRRDATALGRVWKATKLLVRRHPIAPVAFVLLLAVVAPAALANLLAPYGVGEAHYTAILKPPLSSVRGDFFLLGTDQLGRDLFSRILYGTRVSLLVGGLAVIVGTGLGSVIGIASAFIGGRFEIVLQRVMDAMMSIPTVLLALLLLSVLTPGIWNVGIIVAIALTPRTNRVVRGAALAVLGSEFITAARATGSSGFRIAARHIFPNVTTPIIVVGTMDLGTAILVESFVSFLGLGPPPPNATLGLLVGESKTFFLTHIHLFIWPAFTLSLLVFTVNMLGDELRDILDPLLKRQ